MYPGVAAMELTEARSDDQSVNIDIIRVGPIVALAADGIVCELGLELLLPFGESDYRGISHDDEGMRLIYIHGRDLTSI